MQIYPEKYEQLELTAEERSFLRTIERALSSSAPAYYVLHINPRRKDIGAGKPELFNLLVLEDGILLLRFLDVADSQIAELTLTAIGNPFVFSTMNSDIVNRLKESRYLTDTNKELIYNLKICFVFPNVERGSIYNSQIDKEFLKNNVIFKEDIQDIRKNGVSALATYLQCKTKITEENINHIFQRLCPEITIPRKYLINEYSNLNFIDSNLSSADRAVLSYRLDTKQIDIVNKISCGHQLILACAGSGKSVLLISKCFKLASLNPSQQFLITCYNRNLHDYYQWAIAQAGFTERNVKCSTFLGLCNQLLENNHIAKPSYYGISTEEYYERLFQTANTALEKGLIKERFFGVFIDEVQIFKPEWYRFCFNLLKSKDPNNYYFIIAGDKSQNIKNNIKNRRAPWHGGGVGYPEYRGKTLPIEINYRNSKPINDAIDSFVNIAKNYGTQIGVDLASDPEMFLRGTAYREGNSPTIVELTDMSNEGEADAICRAIKSLIQEKGLSEVDIAVILYNENGTNINTGWKTRYYKLLPYIRQCFYREDWEPPTVLMKGESEGATYGSRRGVTITSIEGSLGLDFRAVVLAGLRPLGNHEHARSQKDFENLSSEDLADRLEGYKKNVNFLYTGCTRAKDELTIILSAKQGESIYMDLIRKSMKEEK